jgi:hypothetical protein
MLDAIACNPQPRGYMPDIESERIRRYERACVRHGLVLAGPDGDLCPRGHRCCIGKSWYVVEVLPDGGLAEPVEAALDPAPKLTGRDGCGYAATLAGRIQRAKVATALGVAAATEARRAQNRDKTHCHRGHVLDAENTLLQERPDGTIWRACRACKNAWTRAYAAQRRAAYRARRTGQQVTA